MTRCCVALLTGLLVGILIPAVVGIALIEFADIDKDFRECL